MSEKLKKQTGRRKPQEEIVSILAEKYSVSERYVQMVISGDKKSEAILEDYVSYKEANNLLLEEVKRVVPFLN
ncbi:MAG: hypothetical protein ACT4OJ_04270 [Bacteroidota bacterium]